MCALLIVRWVQVCTANVQEGPCVHDLNVQIS